MPRAEKDAEKRQQLEHSGPAKRVCRDRLAPSQTAGKLLARAGPGCGTALKRRAVSPRAVKLLNRFRRDSLRNKRLDHIATFDVAVVRDGDTALHAAGHLASVVFEAAQRSDFAFEDDYVVAQQPHFGIALDQAIAHAATGNRSHLWNAECLLHLGAALVGFFDGRFKQAGHGALDLVLPFVNDRVQANVDFFLVAELLRFALRTHVEAN